MIVSRPKNENDPATVGAVPGHGSTSRRDTEMNDSTNTTARPRAPVVNVMDLEGPIADASRMASILARLLTESIGGKAGPLGTYHLTTVQCEDMLFAVYHTEELIRRIFTKVEELA